MSEPNLVPRPPLTREQLEKIGGGGCTAEELVKVTEDLIQAYDNLVDFTSHVIERVAG